MSDLDIIFGDSKPSYGNGKYTRSGGSLCDAEQIFGDTSSSYKTDRFGSSKSMSVTSDRTSATASYKIYEGIQNAAFSDYSSTETSIGKTPAETISSYTTSYTAQWNKPQEEEDEFDLK